MKLIENLEQLKIGDWVKVYDKDEEQKHFKIGEITHKWEEKNHPCFQLKLFQTNLPLTTQQLIQRMSKKMNVNIEKYTQSKCNDKERIFKLNQKEKNTLLKKMILNSLK